MQSQSQHADYPQLQKLRLRFGIVVERSCPCHHLRLIVRSNCPVFNSTCYLVMMIRCGLVKKLPLLAFIKIILYTTKDSINL
jgi:hypothetical protein